MYPLVGAALLGGAVPGFDLNTIINFLFSIVNIFSSPEQLQGFIDNALNFLNSVVTR
jgi:hypothetical protein